jgi:hypothetical protein
MVHRSLLEAQILRPLQWFGLLEGREEKSDTGHFTSRHLYTRLPYSTAFFHSRFGSRAQMLYDTEKATMRGGSMLPSSTLTMPADVRRHYRRRPAYVR